MTRLELEFATGRPADQTWAAFTDPSELVRWWPDAAELDVRPGGSYSMSWHGPGWRLRGTYRAVDEPHRLAFSWEWDHEDLPSRDVEIVIDDGLLRVFHEYGEHDERDSYEEGWTYFVGRLLEQG